MNASIQESHRTDMQAPSPTPDAPLSIVIRALNSAATLPSVLEALHPRPTDQLLLVDSGSTDATCAIARRFNAEIHSIASADFTYGRALNLGFRHARHPWVLALSSHTVPATPDFLNLYRRALPRFPSTVSAAVGPIVITDLDLPLPGGITFYDLADFTHGWGFGAGNPNALYRRQAWTRRPFDESLPGGEDLQWYLDALRAGEQVAAVHRAAVRYIPRQGFRAFYRKGRVDYRAATRLIQPHAPSLGGILVRIAKLLLQALTGQVGPAAARASIAHCLGNYVESRARRTATPDSAAAIAPQKTGNENRSS